MHAGKLAAGMGREEMTEANVVAAATGSNKKGDQ